MGREGRLLGDRIFPQENPGVLAEHGTESREHPSLGRLLCISTSISQRLEPEREVLNGAGGVLNGMCLLKSLESPKQRGKEKEEGR